MGDIDAQLGINAGLKRKQNSNSESDCEIEPDHTLVRLIEAAIVASRASKSIGFKR